MGVDYTSLDALLYGIQYTKNFDFLLTLGRQEIHRPPNILSGIFQKYGVNVKSSSMTGYIENMLHDIGFKHIDSLDASNYENASIIHDMNHPIPPTLRSKYDFIYDGGTIEHIFNMPQVCENIIDMLNIDGIFCSVTCNNNFSGHGIYQFSPEFFFSAFAPKYGMEVIEIFLAENETGKDEWLYIQPCHQVHGGRNTSKFNSLKEVYIITIAKKISNDRVSILMDPPQQYSYQTFDWK